MYITILLITAVLQFNIMQIHIFITCNMEYAMYMLNTQIQQMYYVVASWNGGALLCHTSFFLFHFNLNQNFASKDFQF